jgi:hypothetical protein
LELATQRTVIVLKNPWLWDMDLAPAMQFQAPPRILGGWDKEGTAMPVTKEFTVLMENRPSMLGKICQALADQEVNILALESFPTRGKFVTRFIDLCDYVDSGLERRTSYAVALTVFGRALRDRLGGGTKIYKRLF